MKDAKDSLIDRKRHAKMITVMKFFLLIVNVFLAETRAEQQYNAVSKELANSATLSFASGEKKWGEIIRLFRPLAEHGFAYCTIKYKDQSFTVSESSREVTLVVSGVGGLEKPATHSSITRLEDNVLHIMFSENPDNKEFLAELQRIDSGTYHIIITPPANMSLEQVFQVMDLLCRHIKIGTILVTRSLTPEEGDHHKRFFPPEDIESPCFGNHQAAQKSESVKNQP